MPLSVLVTVPSDPALTLTSTQALSDVGTLEKAIAALPNVQTVRSVVDPMGEGKISDLARPAVQLAKTATAFRSPPSTDINVQ